MESKKKPSLSEIISAQTPAPSLVQEAAPAREIDWSGPKALVQGFHIKTVLDGDFETGLEIFRATSVTDLTTGQTLDIAQFVGSCQIDKTVLAVAQARLGLEQGASVGVEMLQADLLKPANLYGEVRALRIVPDSFFISRGKAKIPLVADTNQAKYNQHLRRTAAKAVNAPSGESVAAKFMRAIGNAAKKILN